jgi:hypothetical protein
MPSVPLSTLNTAEVWLSLLPNACAQYLAVVWVVHTTTLCELLPTMPARLQWESYNGKPGAHQLYVGVMDAINAITPNGVLFLLEGKVLPWTMVPRSPAPTARFRQTAVAKFSLCTDRSMPLCCRYRPEQLWAQLGQW